MPATQGHLPATRGIKEVSSVQVEALKITFSLICTVQSCVAAMASFSLPPFGSAPPSPNACHPGHQGGTRTTVSIVLKLRLYKLPFHMHIQSCVSAMASSSLAPFGSAPPSPNASHPGPPASHSGHQGGTRTTVSSVQVETFQIIIPLYLYSFVVPPHWLQQPLHTLLSHKQHSILPCGSSVPLL